MNNFSNDIIKNSMNSFINTEEKDDGFHIYMYGIISSEDVNMTDLLSSTFGKMDNKDIFLHINSPGGCVFEGFKIYNYLSKFRNRLTTIVEGNANSIASIVALAGKKLLMTPLSKFMIHLPFIENFTGNEYDMDYHKNELSSIKDKLIEIYDNKVKKGYDELLNKLKEESWFYPSQAIEYGFADDFYFNKSEILNKPVNIFNFSNLKEEKLKTIINNKIEKELDIMSKKLQAEINSDIKKLENKIKNLKSMLNEGDMDPKTEEELVSNMDGCEEPKTEGDMVALDEETPMEEKPKEEVVVDEDEMMPEEDEEMPMEAEEVSEEVTPEGSIDKDTLMEVIDILTDEEGMLDPEELTQVIEEPDNTVAKKLAFKIAKENLKNSKTKKVVNKSNIKNIVGIKEDIKNKSTENYNKLNLNGFRKFSDDYSPFK